MDKESNRNTIIFMVCFAAIFGLYQFFVLMPQQRAHQQQLQVQAAAAAAAHKSAAPAGLAGADVPGFAPHPGAVAIAPRVKIDTPSLVGTLSLHGARIDDLALKHYHVSTDPKSPLVQLLKPAGAQPGWFAQVGWLPGSAPEALPDEDAIDWTAPAGAVLTPQTPLVLTYDNGQGLKATRTIAVDDDAMFTVTDQVANATAQPLAIRSYGLVEQQGLPTDLTPSNIVHEGAIGILDAAQLRDAKYKDWKKKGLSDFTSKGGWLGITEKYWLAALIPDQSTQITAKFPVESRDGVDLYKSGYLGPVETVAAGQSLTRTTHIFAGAKTVPVLKAYSAKLGVPKLDWAVDWGNFWFFTIPLFQLLEFLKGYIGNIGLSILALTVIVKAVFFPLANKSYESMSKMKKIAPQVEAIKKQHGEDAAKVQQETMALYQREKINPFMGCLPMLIQIPVFYSLYKVLTVTIEMRQAPFYGWIHDLSAKDPTSIWNLFGLIPYDPSHLALVGPILGGSLHLGVWPLLYGLSMWLSQAMSPPAGVDPAQKLMFQFMPLMFTFIMAQFTVGLLIYWCWNNVLSILQQYLIMHRLKVENPIDGFFANFAKPRPAG